MGHNLWKISRKVKENQSNYSTVEKKAYESFSDFCFGFCCAEVKSEWLVLQFKTGWEGQKSSPHLFGECALCWSMQMDWVAQLTTLVNSYLSGVSNVSLRSLCQRIV